MIHVYPLPSPHRLRGKSDWPAEGMPDCCAPTPEGREPECPYHSNWRAAGGFGGAHVRSLEALDAVVWLSAATEDARHSRCSDLTLGPSLLPADHQNWLRIFCDPNVLENSNGLLAQCTKDQSGVSSFCFPSGATGYSNNPNLFSKVRGRDRRWNDRVAAVCVVVS